MLSLEGATAAMFEDEVGIEILQCSSSQASGESGPATPPKSMARPCPQAAGGGKSCPSRAHGCSLALICDSASRRNACASGSSFQRSWASNSQSCSSNVKESLVRPRR